MPFGIPTAQSAPTRRTYYYGMPFLASLTAQPRNMTALLFLRKNQICAYTRNGALLHSGERHRSLIKINHFREKIKYFFEKLMPCQQNRTIPSSLLQWP